MSLARCDITFGKLCELVYISIDTAEPIYEGKVRFYDDKTEIHPEDDCAIEKAFNEDRNFHADILYGDYAVRIYKAQLVVTDYSLERGYKSDAWDFEESNLRLKLRPSSPEFQLLDDKGLI